MIENAWLYLLFGLIIFIVLLVIFTGFTYMVLKLFTQPEAKTFARHLKEQREAQKEKK